MKFSLKLDEKPYEIEAVRQDDGSYAVTVNGRDYITRIANAGGKDIEVLIGDRSHQIQFDGAQSGGSFDASANGRRVHVESNHVRVSRPRRLTQPTAPAVSGNAGAGSVAAASVPGAVTAPMPGTVIAIDKKEGDHVEAGHRIMTIEAMKMENEIRAERAGTIKEIRVSQGSAVLARDVLAVIG